MDVHGASRAAPSPDIASSTSTPLMIACASLLLCPRNALVSRAAVAANKRTPHASAYIRTAWRTE
eukprot:3239954-Prymnesium_polylepis.1